MNIGKAQAVFEQIRSDKYSETEKLQAIWTVLEMATHNGIKKDRGHDQETSEDMRSKYRQRFYSARRTEQPFI